MTEPELIRTLEALCAAAWPAETIETVQGWRCGFTHGVTGRANSALTIDWTGGDPAAAIAAVEARYRAHGLPPRFKLTPATRPAGLDALLDARGYRVVTRSHVMVAESALAAGPRSTGCAVAVAADPDPAWREAAWPSATMTPAEASVRAGIVDRIPPPRAFATVRIGDRPVGAGLAAIGGGWCCISSLRTLPDVRRRGVARAVLNALAAWAAEEGATALYLQVDAVNAPAVALYAAAGFRVAYDYHYRML